MKCPQCDSSSRVVDSRASPDGIRRRRQCNACGGRFTTYEQLATAIVKVVKAGGRDIEDFSRAKLARAISRVCAHRPVGAVAIRRIVRHIESTIADRGPQAVASWRLAEMVLDQLRNVDTLAYQRFATDYLDEDGALVLRREAPAEDPDQMDLFNIGDRNV